MHFDIFSTAWLTFQAQTHSWPRHQHATAHVPTVVTCNFGLAREDSWYFEEMIILGEAHSYSISNLSALPTTSPLLHYCSNSSHWLSITRKQYIIKITLSSLGFISLFSSNSSHKSSLLRFDCRAYYIRSLFSFPSELIFITWYRAAGSHVNFASYDIGWLL